MKIGLMTSGLWRLRDRIELLTGGKVKRYRNFLGPKVDSIAGWGHKNTASDARGIARQHDIPYIAFEDGFLRSIKPGNQEMPLSLILDRTGIYYDATQPSDLEAHIRKRCQLPCDATETRNAILRLCSSRLSKYNSFTIEDPAELKLMAVGRKDRVLVIDQTAGDASISGALASDDTFELMLDAVLVENPGSEILLRVHPETMTGRKSGHFDPDRLKALAQTRRSLADALESGRLRPTPEPINPWALLEACSKVYCVSSQLGFEALLAGCEVICFGMPFYAGWGLTEDRVANGPRRRGTASLEAVFAGVYFDYCNYFSEDSRKLVTFWQATQFLENKRDLTIQHKV